MVTVNHADAVKALKLAQRIVRHADIINAPKAEKDATLIRLVDWMNFVVEPILKGHTVGLPRGKRHAN